METLICIIGFLVVCGFSGIGLILSLIVAGFKVKPEGEKAGEIDLRQQKKIK